MHSLVDLYEKQWTSSQNKLVVNGLDVSPRIIIEKTRVIQTGCFSTNNSENRYHSNNSMNGSSHPNPPASCNKSNQPPLPRSKQTLWWVQVWSKTGQCAPGVWGVRVCRCSGAAQHGARAFLSLVYRFMLCFCILGFICVLLIQYFFRCRNLHICIFFYFLCLSKSTKRTLEA